MRTKNIYAPHVQVEPRKLCAKTPFLARFGVRIVSRISIVCALCACAKPAPKPADEPFRRIQRHEADIALGTEKLRDGATCEVATSAAEEQVCSATDGICKIAQDLGEADADARCTQASDA